MVELFVSCHEALTAKAILPDHYRLPVSLRIASMRTSLARRDELPDNIEIDAKLRSKQRQNEWEPDPAGSAQHEIENGRALAPLRLWCARIIPPSSFPRSGRRNNITPEVRKCFAYRSLDGLRTSF